MIRTGDGAAIMSPGVKRVAMVFSAQNTGGNMGARYDDIPSARREGWGGGEQTDS